MSEKRGSLTVEAAIVLPVYILLLVFLANFLNVFYLEMVIQSGLNNAGNTLAQYCYAIDLTLGMDNFTLSEKTSAKAAELEKSINDFSAAVNKTLNVFDQKLSIALLPEVIDSGKEFFNATDKLANNLKSIKGEDVANYLLTSTTETGGGMLVKAMVDDYLTAMKVNRNLLDGDIIYGLYITNDGNYDLVLTATYQYRNDLFASLTNKPFAIKQQVIVHPWIGGKTPGLRNGK